MSFESEEEMMLALASYLIAIIKVEKNMNVKKQRETIIAITITTI